MVLLLRIETHSPKAGQGAGVPVQRIALSRMKPVPPRRGSGRLRPIDRGNRDRVPDDPSAAFALMTSLHARPPGSLDRLCARCHLSGRTRHKEAPMPDLILPALAVAGFALLAGYAALCERL
jgi:hypothetical protein